MTRVLVVDDEPQILRALQTTLRGAGYEVDTAATGEEALTKAAARLPEAVILDLVLPDRSGVEVCRELRGWSKAPILILSAVGEESEKVAALDAGADDYVTKPFGLDELLARLRAALRRAVPSGEPTIDVGDLRIDLDKQAVFRGGAQVRLTPHEFGMLRLFAQNEGRLLTHRTILREGLGTGVPGRVALPTRLRVAAPAEDRAGADTAALHPHRAGRRVPLRRPGRGSLAVL